MVQIHRIVARGAAPIGRRNAVRVGTSDGPARGEDRLALGIFWSAAVAADAGAAADFRRLPCRQSRTPERSGLTKRLAINPQARRRRRVIIAMEYRCRFVDPGPHARHTPRDE